MNEQDGDAMVHFQGITEQNVKDLKGLNRQLFPWQYEVQGRPTRSECGLAASTIVGLVHPQPTDMCAGW